MEDQQERDVALGLRQGSSEAWRRLYDAYAERVWRCVARLVGQSSADVADIVQETFLAAARSARTYEPGRGSLWMWLWGIARHNIALHYRKQQRRQRVTDNGRMLRSLEGPEEAVEHAELAALVRTTLLQLPDDYEMLLTSKYLDGESVAEIAARERSTETAIRSKLARARQAFREAFEKYVMSAEY